jgi:hypothetical protein
MVNEINIGVFQHSSVAQLVEQLTVNPILFSSHSFINNNYERLSQIILLSLIIFQNLMCRKIIHYNSLSKYSDTTSASYFRVVYHCRVI